MAYARLCVRRSGRGMVTCKTKHWSTHACRKRPALQRWLHYSEYTHTYINIYTYIHIPKREYFRAQTHGSRIHTTAGTTEVRFEEIWKGFINQHEHIYIYCICMYILLCTWFKGKHWDESCFWNSRFEISRMDRWSRRREAPPTSTAPRPLPR